MALANLPDIASVGATTHGNVRAKVNDVATSVTIMSRRFVRSFSLADMVTGYSTNVPLLAPASGEISSEHPSYPVGTYNSAPALYDLINQASAVYNRVGFGIIIPPGWWALGSKPGGSGVNYILPLKPRMTVRSETGGYYPNQLVRTNNVGAHMFGFDSPAEHAGTDDELMDVTIRDVGLNGNWAMRSGGADWDIINWVKPTTGSWGDSRLRVMNCLLEKALRHAIYYSARGDSLFQGNRIEGAGDSAIKFVGSPDNHIIDNIITSTARHALEGVNSTNWEISGNNMYFCGQNQYTRWDSSTADNVRLNGAGIRLDNCGSIRGDRNRIEDNTGHGIIISSPGAFALTNTYFNNLGTVGSSTDRAAGKKDFTASAGGITASVDGVSCVVINGPSNGNKLGDGVNIHGFARQARDYQQLRHIVEIDAPNSTYKPGRDIIIDILPWPDEIPAQPKNVDDSSRWNAMGGTVGTFWVAPGLVVSSSYPVVLERCAFKWKGALIPEIHGRNQYNRVSELNPYETEIVYAIGTAAVTRTVTAVSWASGTNANKDNTVTYSYSGSTLVGVVGVNDAIRISGCSTSANNGVFNVSAVTASTITVHNYQRSSATGDETGISASLAGPSPALILDTGFDDREYMIRVASKAGSTEDLRVYRRDVSMTTAWKTLSTTGTTRVRKSVFTGWTDV